MIINHKKKFKNLNHSQWNNNPKLLITLKPNLKNKKKLRKNNRSKKFLPLIKLNKLMNNKKIQMKLKKRPKMKIKMKNKFKKGNLSKRLLQSHNPRSNKKKLSIMKQM